VWRAEGSWCFPIATRSCRWPCGASFPASSGGVFTGSSRCRELASSGHGAPPVRHDEGWRECAMTDVRFETQGPVAIVTINRPQVRNAVDLSTAASLADAFRRFDADGELLVAILTGAGGTFCAGADLKAVSEGRRGNRVEEDGDGPMGPTRMLLT